jgi:hypothetical protein
MLHFAKSCRDFVPLFRNRNLWQKFSDNKKRNHKSKILLQTSALCMLREPLLFVFLPSLHFAPEYSICTMPAVSLTPQAKYDTNVQSTNEIRAALAAFKGDIYQKHVCSRIVQPHHYKII